MKPKHLHIIRESRKGNTQAQFKLYELYSKAMFNVCLRMLKNEHDAEDIMQEAFLKAFENIDTYSESVEFGAWLKRIVVNHSLDYLKKKKLAFNEIADIEIEDEKETSNSNYDITRLKDAINELTDAHRVVLNLYVFEGYDHEEIAQILGINTNTSRTHLARAKMKLKKILSA